MPFLSHHLQLQSRHSASRCIRQWRRGDDRARRGKFREVRSEKSSPSAPTRYPTWRGLTSIRYTMISDIDRKVAITYGTRRGFTDLSDSEGGMQKYGSVMILVFGQLHFVLDRTFTHVSLTMMMVYNQSLKGGQCRGPRGRGSRSSRTVIKGRCER